jgi:hypothetical protein
MNHGLIRCIAVLRVMGSDPIVPSLGLDPPHDGRGPEDSRTAGPPRVPGKALSILLAVVWVAIFCASVWTRH